MRSTAACSSSPSFRRCFSTVDRFPISKPIILCFRSPPPPELDFFDCCFLSSTPRLFFLFLIPHALQSDYTRKKQYIIRSDQTKNNRMELGFIALTFGPAGPPRQRGVLLVPQWAQVFFSLLLLVLFCSIISSPLRFETWIKEINTQSDQLSTMESST